MVRKNKRNKEEIAEDWCFVCKDGGLLMVCDFRDCLKAYHACCVGQDDSFLETSSHWTCDSHFCYLCRKASKFKCFCCPTAVCGRCIYDAEFAVVKRNKGFCTSCSKLALLIEDNADVDSDGEKIDFKDRETYEFLFSEYYEIIKEKEGLNSLHAHSAQNFLKNGKNKCDLDLNEIGEDEDGTGESEDDSNLVVSDYDDLNDKAGAKPVWKKKRCMRQLKSIKGKVKDKKKEFIGWGSRSLIEFLKYIGRDTSREFSEHDVTSIIIEYCKEHKLFDPKKKRKVLCDAQLRSLLGRKSVNKNNIQNLLASHFAENFEEIEDDSSSSSEDGDDNESFKCTRQRKLISSTKSHQNLVSEERQSYFAAIVSSNLKLVYLKRSLVEELLKQPETFDGKVMGSFVRVKSDPNDYLQKNSHQLLQVVGIHRSSKNDEINKEILLQLSNMPKDVPISKISDNDFSEEECHDLYQRMRSGRLKQPSVLELEQKARSLHEDIIKHWIPRELALLQNRIDQANEKGWRRELFEYMDRKLKLQAPSEQSRLLGDIPKVIPEIVDTQLSPEGSPRKDRLEKNGLLELAMGETCNSVGGYSKHSGFARCLNNTTNIAGPKSPVKRDQDGTAFPGSVEQLFDYTVSQDKGSLQRKQLQSTTKARQDDPKATLSEELSLESQTFNPAKCSVRQPSNTEYGSGIDGRKLNATTNAKQTIKEKQSIAVADPIKASVTDKEDASISAIPVGEQVVSILTADIIELSDHDEQDANIAEFSLRRQAVENPEISVWHCLGPYGERRGPYSMSVLKRWSETASYPLEFKVWKTGQSEAEAILLSDILRQNFPSM